MNKLTSLSTLAALVFAFAITPAQAGSRRRGSLATGGAAITRGGHSRGTVGRHHGHSRLGRSHSPRIIRGRSRRRHHGGAVFFSIGTPGFSFSYGGGRHFGVFRHRRPYHRRYLSPHYRRRFHHRSYRRHHSRGWFHGRRFYRHRSSRYCR